MWYNVTISGLAQGRSNYVLEINGNRTTTIDEDFTEFNLSTLNGMLYIGGHPNPMAIEVSMKIDLHSITKYVTAIFQPSERLGSTLDACISSIVTSSQDIPLIANATSSGTSMNVQAGCPAEQCGMGVFSVTFTTQQSYIGKSVYSSTTTNYNMISFSFQTR